MTESLLHHLIDHLLDNVDGEVSTRSRVIDGLLDLRLNADERADLVASIDKSLAEMPGIESVPNQWWTETLQTLSKSTENTPTNA